MKWSVFLILSAVCLFGSVVFAFTRAKMKYKSGRILDLSKILFIGVVLSSVILFIPVYLNDFKSTDCGVIETILISIHNVIRLFIVDGEFDFVISNLEGLSGITYKGYTVLFSVLFVSAPILTFGFVLSFFKNVSAYKRYITHYKYNTYIFSELNAKALALAESLYNNDPKKRFFVFTNVAEREDEQSYELTEKARELGAVCFKKDIASIDFSFHSKKRELNFFAIGENQSDNISQALKIVEKYKYRNNTNLYVFSTQMEAEILLENAFRVPDEMVDSDREGLKETKIKVRRINEVRSLVLRNLYEKGYEKVFLSAYDDGTDTKKINAVIIGMGQHGTEMTKALSWFCQMNGYLVQIDSFDVDPGAEERFLLSCPELMQFSGKLDIEGESKYTINIHSGIDVDTADFYNIISSLPRTTYVLVALGNDEKNISTAVKLRGFFERINRSPEIQTVIYDSDKIKALSGITNFKGQSYNIDFIGDMKSSYSEEVILGSDLEEVALKRHLKWGNEEEFWQYDYNYKSSVASAIHRKIKILCKVPGIEKKPDERTQEELWSLRILEHCRWNAYMRSEGYIYSGSVEKNSRNDLAKTHNCLVPFADLPLNEQEKDDD